MKYTYSENTDTKLICLDERSSQLKNAINQLEVINKMSKNPVYNLKSDKELKALKVRNLN